MRLALHPLNPETRLMRQVAQVYAQGGLLVYPTDSGYSLGCDALSRKAVQRLYHLKRGVKKYLMALMFQDFGAITEFARVDNFAFRYMKHLVPGPYTFILPATNRGRKLLDVNREEIGVRLPKHVFPAALYALNRDPILNTSAQIAEDDAFSDPDAIEASFGHAVDLIVDMGPIPIRPTTVISLVDGEAEVVRLGAGPVPEAPAEKKRWL